MDYYWTLREAHSWLKYIQLNWTTLILLFVLNWDNTFPMSYITRFTVPIIIDWIYKLHNIIKFSLFIMATSRVMHRFAPDGVSQGWARDSGVEGVIKVLVWRHQRWVNMPRFPVQWLMLLQDESGVLQTNVKSLALHKMVLKKSLNFKIYSSAWHLNIKTTSHLLFLHIVEGGIQSTVRWQFIIDNSYQDIHIVLLILKSSFPQTTNALVILTR